MLVEVAVVRPADSHRRTGRGGAGLAIAKGMMSCIAELLRDVVQTWDAGAPEFAYEKLFDGGATVGLGVLAGTNGRLILELRCANPRGAEWRAALDDLVRVVDGGRAVTGS